MKINYDFHIHSCLSPCADNENTPLNIVAMASVKGINAIAVADHNAIANVKVAMLAGECFDITVIPAVEVQTNEEIHVLALFKTYEELESFFNKLSFFDFKNDKTVFGDQLIVNEENEIVGEEERMLLNCADIGLYDLIPLILNSGGKAVPAHIDREANGVLNILGELPADLPYSAIEFSPYASKELKDKYSNYKQIINSDAHSLDNIFKGEGCFNAENLSVDEIFNNIL